jgi:hypothetical protein
MCVDDRTTTIPGQTIAQKLEQVARIVDVRALQNDLAIVPAEQRMSFEQPKKGMKRREGYLACSLSLPVALAVVSISHTSALPTISPIVLELPLLVRGRRL